MRRLVLLLLLAGLVAGACGETVVSGEEMAPTDEPAVASTNITAAETEPAALPTGREAIAASAGVPYALWFWGAH